MSYILTGNDESQQGVTDAPQDEGAATLARWDSLVWDLIEVLPEGYANPGQRDRERCAVLIDRGFKEFVRETRQDRAVVQ